MLQDYINELESTKRAIISIIKDIEESNRVVLEVLKSFDDENRLKLNEAKDILRNISSRAVEIDNKLVLILAKYSPEARDLRKVVAYLKLTTVLSRISTNTRNLIKGISNIGESYFNKVKEFYIPMQKEVIEALELLLEMLNCDSSDEVNDIYNKIVVCESKLDDYYEVLEEHIFELAGNDLEEYKKYQKLLTALRKSEKIGDRILIAASLILFAKIGGELNIFS